MEIKENIVSSAKAHWLVFLYVDNGYIIFINRLLNKKYILKSIVQNYCIKI